ncbi:MAG: CBS domain-containing protein [Candidatus Electronema aureum]|uniref:CBS domain-containing protein n=1 Tax=Candidatus Electronema aureum TaxID=2005002 RepID=A0A521G0C6_9BACT|nr:MAG: CBS domain-containing protein [Candidatus Electronema aureum]
MSEKEGEGREKSFWQRLQRHLFRSSPDTAQELEHEIQELLEDGEEHGLISRHEEQLINSIFNFRATVASEIMTPASEIISADLNSSVEEIIQLICEEGYTRIPVFSGGHDNIVGTLHAKDLLRIASQQTDKPIQIEDCLNPPVLVAESKPITELLRDFQSGKNHMAIVTDEFGSVRGLITLEDVLEEIVGEIDDEHDQHERELMLEVDLQTVVADARIDVEAVEKHFDCLLPDGPYESLGGLLIHLLGRMPGNGETVTTPPLTFKVLTSTPRRVRTVRIRKL